MNNKPRHRVAAIVGFVGAVFLSSAPICSAQQAPKLAVDQDGTIHVPAHEVPLSSYMSEEAKRAYLDKMFSPSQVEMAAGVEKYRQTMDLYFYEPKLSHLKEMFPVAIEPAKIGGVQVDVIQPRDGVAPKNRNRVLINLHGGGFRIGEGLGGLVESVPVAGLGKIEVISVYYRQGPEHSFPAASEDVAAVYRELLKSHKPENIGIFGVSAGGVLAAMATAWFQKEKLPRPGAIGLLCAPADDIWGGDSRFIAAPFMAQIPPSPMPNPPETGMPYVEHKDLNNPLVSPAVSIDVLAEFPPTLIITGTRDGAMSAAINSHARLVKAGVDADLHVWDGMWHCFTNEIEVPEARDALDVVVKFFDHRLGKLGHRHQ